MKILLIGDVDVSGRRKSCCLYTDEEINIEGVYYEPAVNPEEAFYNLFKCLTLECQKKFLLEHPGGTFYRINKNKYTEKELYKIERLLRFKPKLQTVVPNLISFLK